MESRTINALELPRVLACLAGFAVSEAGRDACLALRPLPDHAAIRREAAMFEQGRLFVALSETRLAPFAAADALLQNVALPAAVLDLDDLFVLRVMLAQGQSLANAMVEERTASAWPLWVERVCALPMPERTVSGLSRCLNDDGLIRDAASPELSLVRSELRRLHQQCARKVKDYAAEYNILHFLQDSFMTLSSDRYVLPLKANFKGRLQGIIHDYSQTGETCYFEPLFLIELNNRLQELKREEREEERKILLCLSSLVRDELPGILAVYAFLVDLDLLFARTALANCYDGRMVEFVDGPGLELREARHPLLALAESEAARNAWRCFERQAAANDQHPPAQAVQPPRSGAPRVVSSNLELASGQRALVISGGNAGGKTVSLKSAGLIALMSLCALPVPVAPGSVLPRWSKIYAFIGDEQSLEDHVSTFTAQIRHLGQIWPELGPDSLVILDEFGAGTDPSQGAALAQAVLDSLLELGAYVVAATHFPALKAYALSTKGVRAASVLFDPDTRKPLYRLVYDQVGASQALDVAREHGLPDPILRRAEQYLLVSGEDSSTLVERLNTLAVAKEGELAALAKERATFAEKRRALRERFEKERARLFDTVQAEAKKVLQDWKASRISHKHALKELSRVRATLAPREDGADEAGQSVDLAALAPRMRVRHMPWKRTGTVLEVDLRKQRARLDFDGVSLWAGAKDIALLESGPSDAASAGGSSVTGTGAGPRNMPLRLDLRGMRADVAVSELEKFIDGAIIGGRDEVEIIHGRGTGVLRREIHTSLKAFPSVLKFALAPEDRGGDGMTIVELK